jgi:hypothetical protein
MAFSNESKSTNPATHLCPPTSRLVTDFSPIQLACMAVWATTSRRACRFFQSLHSTIVNRARRRALIRARTERMCRSLRRHNPVNCTREASRYMHSPPGGHARCDVCSASPSGFNTTRTCQKSGMIERPPLRTFDGSLAMSAFAQPDRALADLIYRPGERLARHHSLTTREHGRCMPSWPAARHGRSVRCRRAAAGHDYDHYHRSRDSALASH